MVIYIILEADKVTCSSEIKYVSFSYVITFAYLKHIYKFLHNWAPQVLSDLVLQSFRLSNMWRIQWEL